MDYEFLSRLQKKLEDLYQVKFSSLLNSKEFGDLREAQGYMKAIKVFGELISDSNNINKPDTK